MPGTQAGARLDGPSTRCWCVAGGPDRFAQRQPDGRFQGWRLICAALWLQPCSVRPRRCGFVALDTVHGSWTIPHRPGFPPPELGFDAGGARGNWSLAPCIFFEAGKRGRLEPLAPLLRSDDADFSRIVRWVVHALLEAEWHAISRSMRGVRTCLCRGLPMTQAWPWGYRPTGPPHGCAGGQLR